MRRLAKALVFLILIALAVACIKYLFIGSIMTFIMACHTGVITELGILIMSIKFAVSISFAVGFGTLAFGSLCKK